MADLDYEAGPEDLVEDVEEMEVQEVDGNGEDGDAAGGVKGSGLKQKGRGFKDPDRKEDLSNARYESLEGASGTGPAHSVEGWVLFVTGLHEEAQEEDVVEAFAEYGDVKNCYLNLDRQTGYVKGYALIEYAIEKEAQAAIDALDGSELLTQKIRVTWAFVRGPARAGGARRRR